MSLGGFKKGGTAGFIGQTLGNLMGFGDAYEGPSPMDPELKAAFDAIPDAPMPEGTSVQSILAEGMKPQPWQGTQWSQMDPAYQQYVKAAFGVTGDPQAQKNFDRMVQRKTLDRALGSTQPNLGPQLNPYQLAAQGGWGTSAGVANGGQEVGLGQPIMPWGGASGPFAGALYQPMSYAQWQALRLPTGGGGGGGGNGDGTTPTPNPDTCVNGVCPMPDLPTAYQRPQTIPAWANWVSQLPGASGSVQNPLFQYQSMGMSPSQMSGITGLLGQLFKQ